MYKPHHIASPDRSRKQATFLSRVPVHCITPFCSDALVSPPNLYPPCSTLLPYAVLYTCISFLFFFFFPLFYFAFTGFCLWFLIHLFYSVACVFLFVSLTTQKKNIFISLETSSKTSRFI